MPAATSEKDVSDILAAAATAAAAHFRPFAASAAQRMPAASKEARKNGGKGYCEVGDHAVSVGTQFLTCRRCKLSACAREACRGVVSASVAAALQAEPTMEWMCLKCTDDIAAPVDDGDLISVPIDEQESGNYDAEELNIDSEEREIELTRSIGTVHRLQRSFDKLLREFMANADFQRFRAAQIALAAADGCAIPWNDVCAPVNPSLVPKTIAVPNDFFGDRRSTRDMDFHKFLARIVNAERASHDRNSRVQERRGWGR